jgi:hypothetical protein
LPRSLAQARWLSGRKYWGFRLQPRRASSTAAEPSGLWGALKEAFASGSALAAAKSNAGSNELVKAVVADFETKEGRSAVQEALRQHLAGAAKPADAVQRSLANLRDVSAILNAKAPQDAAGFKAWLQAIGRNVAEASDEVDGSDNVRF